MLNALTLLFLCQLAGEVIVQALGITFPGPVLGMGLLFGGPRSLLGRSGAALDAVADTILRSLSLLFVPAAVGVMQQAGLIAANWLAIFAALAVSTVADAGGHGLHLPRRRPPRRRAGPMSDAGLYRIWVYLADTPLLWLTATLAAFAVGDWVSARLRRHPLANPVVIVGGPADRAARPPPAPATAPTSRGRSSCTSCSARPRWRSACRSGATAPRSAATSCRCAPPSSPARSPRSPRRSSSPGRSARPREILASLAAKSVTAPIAMALTESIGGIPALAAVLVVLTGILGSVIVTPLMNALRITDYAARGFAVGVASHGIGTARAFQVSEEAGHLRRHRHGPERRADRARLPRAAAALLTPAPALTHAGAAA